MAPHFFNKLFKPKGKGPKEPRFTLQECSPNAIGIWDSTCEINGDIFNRWKLPIQPEQRPRSPGARQKSSQQQSPFFRLPAEIRRPVYLELIGRSASAYSVLLEKAIAGTTQQASLALVACYPELKLSRDAQAGTFTVKAQSAVPLYTWLDYTAGVVGYFEDNSFPLLPDEKRTLRFVVQKDETRGSGITVRSLWDQTTKS